MDRDSATIITPILIPARKSLTLLPWSLVGVSLLIVAFSIISPSVHLYIISICFFWPGVILLMTSPNESSVMTVTGEQIEDEDHQSLLHFSEVEGIRFANRTALEETYQGHKKSTLELIHSGGYFTIPNLSPKVAQEIQNRIESVLISQLSQRNTVNELKGFWNKQVELFDESRIYAFKSRENNYLYVDNSLKKVLGAICLVGFSAVLVGAIGESFEWTSVGIMVGIISSIILIIISISREARNRSAQNLLSNSGIVISPGGLALRQQDMKGVLRWDEIQDIVIPKNKNWSQALELKIAGGKIILSDVYEVPMSIIRELLTSYWQPPE